MLWQDDKYKSSDFLGGLPGEAKTKNYQSYKNAFSKKSDFNKWDYGMKGNAGAILEAEAGVSTDPTRGATNWGGGSKNYNWAVKVYGSANVVTLNENGGTHNFYSITKGCLSPENEIKPVQGPAPEPTTARKPIPFSEEVQGAPSR